MRCSLLGESNRLPKHDDNQLWGIEETEDWCDGVRLSEGGEDIVESTECQTDDSSKTKGKMG